MASHPEIIAGGTDSLLKKVRTISEGAERTLFFWRQPTLNPYAAYAQNQSSHSQTQTSSFFFPSFRRSHIVESCVSPDVFVLISLHISVLLLCFVFVLFVFISLLLFCVWSSTSTSGTSSSLVSFAAYLHSLSLFFFFFSTGQSLAKRVSRVSVTHRHHQRLCHP